MVTQTNWYTLNFYSVLSTLVFPLILSKDFNIEVLKKFIEQHNFKGRSIVDALRCALPSASRHVAVHVLLQIHTVLTE